MKSDRGLNWKLIIGQIAAVMLITGCCKEPVTLPPLPDPCAGKKPVTADFKIKEVLGPGSYWSSFKTETDDILTNKNVIFEAVEQDAQYTWYIGSEVLTTRNFGRYFNESYVGQTIPVTLIVEKEPSTLCFPNDPGRDSVTKYMKVHDFCDLDNSLMNGTFRIAREMQTDSFDFQIEMFEHQSTATGLCSALSLYNTDGQGNNCITGPTNWNVYEVAKNWRFLKKFSGPDLCFGIDMTAQMHLNGEFELFFLVYNANTFPEHETRRFFGRKLN
jgi:hypothetical protein